MWTSGAWTNGDQCMPPMKGPVGYSSRIDIVVLLLCQTLGSSEPPPHRKSIPSTHSLCAFVQVIPPATTSQKDDSPPFPFTTKIKFRQSRYHSHRTSSQLSTPLTPTTKIYSKVSRISSAKYGGLTFSALPSSRVWSTRSGWRCILGEGMSGVYDNAAGVVEDVWEFEKNHSTFVVAFALGILAVFAPLAVEVMGFGQLGPIGVGWSLCARREISSYIVFL